MTIAIVVGRDEPERNAYQWFIDELRRELLLYDPRLNISIWPEFETFEQIELALVWGAPFGILHKFTSLKCIASLGAGVDHLFEDKNLPSQIPIIRVMDPYMANDIVQYVVTYVLHYIKRVDHWAANQKLKKWAKQPPFNFSDKTIGIMGLGYLGQKTAETLQFLGLNVIGWSQSSKNLNEIKTYVGEKELNAFLSMTDILICLLPLTRQTQNILNTEVFSKLKKGSCLINLGRGKHLVEEDLLKNLASGQLSRAYLDVFRSEPLPLQHPFWNHPNIVITPHIASVTNPKTVIKQLMEAYKKLLAGEKIANLIDREKEY